MADKYAARQQQPIQEKENTTGLPDTLKTGIENLSGYSMDDVQVNYNSRKPALLQAHAYAQGTDIHLSPGQEKHLPHEAWHVVQQKQGRVKPTLQMKGTRINDDVQLEKEAEVMGTNALQMHGPDSSSPVLPGSIYTRNGFPATEVLQAVFSQNPADGLQESHHGGVKSQYDTPNNLIELHIEAGANAEGEMMQDFLMALWEARDTITAGQHRNAGGVFMRPGGAQVLKMTMELLGEALGQGAHLAAARNQKTARKSANIPLWVDPTGRNAQNDILDTTVVPENLSYRNAMVGAPGIDMRPIGGGTSGGSVNMLANTPAALNERALYDAALIGLRPFMSLGITISLATVTQVIDMMEGKIGFFKTLYLKALYVKNG
jgi:hypothetical protein